MKKERVRIILIAIVAILSIPLIAMQFTDQVSWGLLDFVIMAILLFSGSVLIHFVNRKAPRNYRIILYAGIVAICLFIWAELAVGIIGSPFAGS